MGAVQKPTLSLLLQLLQWPRMSRVETSEHHNDRFQKSMTNAKGITTVY